MFAAAAVAGVHAARRREAERALVGLMVDPLPLYNGRAADLLEPVWLLFVYIHDVNLVSKFANTRIQLRVRYGDNGCYQEKYSQKVRSSTPAGAEQAKANFESMFVYPWSRELAPSVMVDLVKLGFIDWTISTAAMRIPFDEGQPGAIEHDVLFFGKKGEDGFIGQLNLFLEVRSITRAELELGIDSLALSILSPTERELARPAVVSLGPAPSIGNSRLHTVAVGSPIGNPVDGTPVVLGQAMPTGVSNGGPGIVQGSVVHTADSRPRMGASSVPRPREETFRGSDGRLRHVIITRQPNGEEERLEWIE
jgi:hypothetical protein